MFDLISVGNISIDLYYKGNSLTYDDSRFQLAVGGKYEADRFYQSVGGGGANVAIGAVQNGLHTAAWGIIGDNPFKRIILDELEQKEVSTKYVQIEKNVMNISSILLTPYGERSIIHYSNISGNLHTTQRDLLAFQNARVIYLGNMAHVSLDEKITIAQSVDLNSNKQLVINLGIADCRRSKESIFRLLRYADIVIVNGHEFAELVKAPYKDIHFKEHVIQWYLPQLEDKLFIITEGKKGSYAYQNKKMYHVPGVTLDKIVDATGAGDGYTSAFIAHYFRKKNVEQAMEKATQYAGKILRKIGAN